MTDDPRPVHVKIVAGRFVTVYPPTQEVHDETVWRRPKAGSHHSLVRQVATIDGRITSLNDILDEEDQSDLGPL